MGVGLNVFLLHLPGSYCREKSKAACKKFQGSLVGGVEEGSTERARNSPASPTGLQNTPEFMEKASVFLGCGQHSLSPGSMAL